MAIWTYVENQDPRSKTTAVQLEEGLILYIGTYANLTASQLNEINSSGAGIVLKEGIVPPATPAGGGGGGTSNAATVVVWTEKTNFKENQLVVSPEGELLRTLRNFTSGETYVF